MRDFLSDYITTLSTKRKERVYDLLRPAKTDKANLDSLASKLNSTTFGDPISLTGEAYGGKIESSNITSMFAAVMGRFNDMFDASNLISLLLDTYSSVLSSDIKALEDEIEAMLKAMDNYAFTLADNGSYDFSFIETFNDDTMRLDTAMAIPDRSGIPFRSDEQAIVNAAAGTLSLAPTVDLAQPMFGKIMNSNCNAYVTSSIGIQHALDDSLGNGWRVAVSSPRPVSATIGGVTRQGAQFELELTLKYPNPCDSIVFTPFSDRPIEILKLEVVPTNNQNGNITLLDGVKLIDKPTTFGFALTRVASVKVLVNQPVYYRGKLNAMVPEETYKVLHNTTKDLIQPDTVEMSTINGVYRRNRKALNRTLMRTLNNTASRKEIKMFHGQAPQIDFDPGRGPFSVMDAIKNQRQNYGQNEMWKAKSEINTLFRRMIHEKIFSSSPEVLGGLRVISPTRFYVSGGRQLNSLFKTSDIPSTANLPTLDSNVDATILKGAQSSPNFLNYEYELGFRNIKIGRSKQIFRGVFVSKTMPAQSDSGEVKIKVDDTDYFVVNSDRDSKLVTSIEYSVTNQSNARDEEDWIPIIPINKNSQVTAERLFVSEAGAGNFRFSASKQGDMRIYRNGYLVDLMPLTFVETANRLAWTGVRFPIGTVTPSDIFTVDYEAFGDNAIINFEQRGFEKSTLASAFDEAGAGETFKSTFNARSVRLQREPYIDYDQVEKKGSYSETLGFLGSYSPITIVMEDGTTALNQTNYLGLAQNDLSQFDTSRVAFLQSGQNITFNQVLDQSFTVYYQYLPSNIKFRTVLRVNDVNYVSPQINSVQLKTKTRKPDAKRSV